MAKSGDTGITNAYTDDMLSRERTMDCIMQCSLGDNTIYLELSMIWRRDKSLAERENMQHRGSSDSRATADSHCAAQGSRNEMEMSRQRSCRDVLLIWLVKLQERVKRVDAFVRDTIVAPFSSLSFIFSRVSGSPMSRNSRGDSGHPCANTPAPSLNC